MGLGLRNRHRYAACLGLRLRFRAAIMPSVRGWLIRGRPFAGGGRVAHVNVRRRRGLALHLGRRAQDRLHRLHIPCAAAEYAGDSRAYRVFAGLRLLVQQVLGGQDLRRRAVAALDGAALDKLLLQCG